MWERIQIDVWRALMVPHVRRADEEEERPEKKGKVEAEGSMQLGELRPLEAQGRAVNMMRLQDYSESGLTKVEEEITSRRPSECSPRTLPR